MGLMLRYLKNYKGLLIINLISLCGFALVELGIPTVIAKVIDIGIVNKDFDYIKRMGIIIAIISIIGVIGTIISGYCATKVSSRISRDIRNDVFRKIQTYSHAEFNKYGVSSMITRTTNDAYMILQFTHTVLRTALLTPIMFIISLIMILRTSPKLSLILVGAIPLIVIGVIVIAKISNPLSKSQQHNLDSLNRVSRENLTGIRVIRAFGNDDYENKRFGKVNADYTEVSKKLNKLMAVSNPLFFFLLNLGIIMIFWISSKMINLGQLEVGQLVAFIEYLFHAMFSIMLFSMVFIMYPRAQVSANRLEELLNETPSIVNPVNGVKETELRGEIEFDNVSFSYPNSEECVIKNISFKGSKGETIAFIGSTGSGKSTLINLIPRFYDVTKGSIKVNGIDIREYDLKALRRKIGFIPQKSVLFTGTIANNIRFGKKNASTGDIEYSAKVAEAYDFISKKPKQVNEVLSEGGSNVSGGQKQRLSIARALVRKPEIYIFDDSFSALDFKTDALLRARLKKETKDAVVLIVAQRIGSIIDADKIVVLNEGEIVGIGKHKELLKECPIYKEIALSQLSEEELA